MNGPRILARLALGAGLVWLALAGGASAESAPLKPVTLVLEWTGFQPQHFGFWIAKERGWYAAEGLDVAIKSSAGGTKNTTRSPWPGTGPW